jgi:CheY-like chemotaxis protein
VKSLVALHGGRVEARSDGLGRGSTFVVRLPLLAREPAPPPGGAAPTAAGAGPARRILVADDNADAASTLATLLELQGHQVWTAEDGVVALEKARTLRPDIVFLDLGMPRMGGLEAARHLREEGLAPPARLVAVTGWGQEADRARTREAGFDAHLVKPVDMATLEAVLATAPAPGVDNTAP